MATLIKSSEDLKTYVSTAFNFTYSNIEPYVKNIERTVIKKLIGDNTYNAWASVAPTSGVPQQVFLLLQEASANLSVLVYIPIGVVNITDIGIVISSNTNTTPASYGQVLDLKRSFEQIGNHCIEEALQLMEANKSDFPLWTQSSAYTVFKELLVQTTQEFNTHFNISNSRQTFIALKPYQKEAQNQIFTWLDANTFFQIKEADAEFATTLPSNIANDLILSLSKQAQQLAQAAQVNYTVVKAAESGMFDFKPTGLFKRSDATPTEKHLQLNEHQIQRLIRSRLDAGDDFIKQLKQLLAEYPTVFTNYQAPTNTTDSKTVNTKSIVSF